MLNTSTFDHTKCWTPQHFDHPNVFTVKNFNIQMFLPFKKSISKCFYPLQNVGSENIFFAKCWTPQHLTLQNVLTSNICPTNETKKQNKNSIK